MATALKKKTVFDIRTYSAMRCPMHGLLSLLTGPWTTYILWLIRSNGEMRFGQLKKQMPAISAKVLTERLRMLEEAGIVLRVQEAIIPPKVTYSFTERGHQLENLLDEINTLAVQWSGDGKHDEVQCMLDKKLK
jgi:DNA-binding HxlR family transcriptional regulator